MDPLEYLFTKAPSQNRSLAIRKDDLLNAKVMNGSMFQYVALKSVTRLFLKMYWILQKAYLRLYCSFHIHFVMLLQE